MWVWTLNWGQVRHDIVVGSCPRTISDLLRIRAETGVQALLSLQTEECRSALGIVYEDLERHSQHQGLLLANAPMRDFDTADQRKGLPGAVAALQALVGAGRKTYVHCTAGINRAPLTVLAYLTFVAGMTVPAAMELIRVARPDASPYWDSYFGCRGDVLASMRSAVERRAWELSQAHPHRSADANWFRAEDEILRQAFTSPADPT